MWTEDDVSAGTMEGMDGVLCELVYGVAVECVFLMRRRPPRSTQSRSSAASDVYKRQG